jgi:ankyrin repeat protein
MNETTAIGIAVAQGSIELVSLLIEAGANANEHCRNDERSYGGQGHYKREHWKEACQSPGFY